MALLISMCGDVDQSGTSISRRKYLEVEINKLISHLSSTNNFAKISKITISWVLSAVNSN